MGGEAREAGGGRRVGSKLTLVREVIIIKYFPNCKKIKGLRDAKKIKYKCPRRWLFWQSKFACNHF
jgi:hypothetical protein